MKRNGIIYPNTPFFRKYAGKMRIPLGGCSKPIMFAYPIDIFQWYTLIFSETAVEDATFKANGGNVEICVFVDAFLIDAELYASLLEILPDVPQSVIGSYASVYEIFQPIAGSEFTLTAYDGGDNEIAWCTVAVPDIVMSTFDEGEVLTITNKNVTATNVTYSGGVALTNAERGLITDAVAAQYPSLSDFIGANYVRSTINAGQTAGQYEVTVSVGGVAGNAVIVEIDPDFFYLQSSSGTSTVTLQHIGGNYPSLEASVGDTLHFSPWNGDTIQLTDGQKLFLRGNNQGIAQSTEHFSRFVMTGNVVIGGNMATMLNRYGAVERLGSFCFFHLFEDCAALKNAEAAYIEDSVKPGISCFQEMFVSSGIAHLPSITMTLVADAMFMGMCYNCANLLDADIYCDDMAADCFSGMFNGCVKLQEVKTRVRLWNDQNSFEWMKDVAMQGTFHCYQDCTIMQDNISGIPDGWTRVDLVNK